MWKHLLWMFYHLNKNQALYKWTIRNLLLWMHVNRDSLLRDTTTHTTSIYLSLNSFLCQCLRNKTFNSSSKVVLRRIPYREAETQLSFKPFTTYTPTHFLHLKCIALLVIIAIYMIIVDINVYTNIEKRYFIFFQYGVVVYMEV